MMTEVEKKAIENIKEMIELHDDDCLITTDDDFECLKVLLCLIKEKIEEYNKKCDECNFQKTGICKELLGGTDK